MPLDGVTASFLGEELADILTGARIDKVQQPSRFDILIQFRSRGRNQKLLLSANPSNPRIHITSESREQPRVAPGFCMLLRKYLVGSRIEKVDVPDYDRVFIFHILSQDELGDQSTRRLILEVMGKHSNLIFVSASDVILDAINHVDSSMSRVREVLPAHPYVPAPVQDKLLPADALQRLAQGNFWIEIKEGKPDMKLETYLLNRLQGFSPQLVREVMERAGIDGRAHAQGLDPESRMRIDSELRGLLGNILAGLYEPGIFYLRGDGPPTDFHALPLRSLGMRKPASSLSEAMDTYYQAREKSNQYRQRRQYLERIVGQARQHTAKKRDIHRKDLQSSHNYEEWRQKGDVLLANMHLVKEGDKSLVAQNFYDPEMKDIEIQLNEYRSPSWNSQHIFKQYQKNKTRYEQSARFLAQDEAELAWLESLQNALNQAESMADLAVIRDEMRQTGLIETTGPKKGAEKGDFKSRKQARRRGAQGGEPSGGKGDGSQPLPVRKYRSSDGFTILAGRNNIQNDKLTLKTARKHDIWMHIQKAAGTHVIIQTEGREVPDQTLIEAAETAAWFSRPARGAQELQSGAKMPVDYCPVSHVRKPGGARPGMVIYDNYSTVMVEPRDPARLEIRGQIENAGPDEDDYDSLDSED